MKLKEIIELLNAKVVVDNNIDKIDIEKVTASDLMSDVLALGEEGSLLVTGLASPQCIRTAAVVGIPAVVIVRNRDIMPETINAAKNTGITLLSTKYGMFETCGILYSNGLKPIKILR
ncbi:DRTGG domain-containing protein [Thermosipho atlanticus]|uniref:DRTGG domain-containing protein n=1 Tax=Thermosipho atlanticus DSM 15807 TaxID=1123380 RepID=A0A1M5SGZ8_9BACT|nr:DRTGG domain-containing protein [Thermosipho atlanticus]SHH37769.1 DRTGG domain-containing protein [Thermosipho atlanticus DSM 15807]